MIGPSLAFGLSVAGGAAVPQHAGASWLLGLCLAGFALWLFARRRRTAGLHGQPFSTCVLFRTPDPFQPDAVIARFKAMWGQTLACGKSGQSEVKPDEPQVYLLGDGRNLLRATVVQTSLTDEVQRAAILATVPVDARNNGLSHTSYIILDSVAGHGSPKVPVLFAARLVLTVLADDQAVAYLNPLAMMCRAKEAARPFLALKQLETPDLFHLLVGLHVVQQEGGLWIHTHGMMQFALPDIHVRFPEPDRQSYYVDLVSTLAIYMIDRGAAVKTGDTADLQGDGIVYEIQAAREEPDHPPGPFGAIEVCRK